MGAILSGLSRRFAGLTVGLASVVVLAGSCTIDAAVTTDRAGRVLSLNALRVRSTVRDVGLALLLRGRELAFELSWNEGLTRSDRPDDPL